MRKNLAWNGRSNRSGSEDCYGVLTLKQSASSSMDVWCEFDASGRTLEWHDIDARRSVTIHSIGGAPVTHRLKISDMKKARELARQSRDALQKKQQKGGSVTVSRPAPLGSVPITIRSHLRFMTKDDEEDAAEEEERKPQRKRGSRGTAIKEKPIARPLRTPPKNAFVVHVGRRAVTFVAKSSEAFESWVGALSLAVGMVNDGGKDGDAQQRNRMAHLMHMCGACDAASRAREAKAVTNDVTSKISAFTGRRQRGGDTTLGGVDFEWARKYEGTFEVATAGGLTQQGQKNEEAKDREILEEWQRNDMSGGSSGSISDDVSGDESDNGSEDYSSDCGSNGSTEPLNGGAVWCELCGTAVPTVSSLKCHMRMCIRRQASSTCMCPTCRYPIPSSELSWHIAHACQGPPAQSDKGIEGYKYPFPSPWPHSNPTPMFLAALRRYGPGRGRVVTLSEKKGTTISDGGKIRDLQCDSTSAPPNPRAPHGRAPCAVCGRRFALHRLQEHQDICIKLKRARPSPPPAMRSQYVQGNTRSVNSDVHFQDTKANSDGDNEATVATVKTELDVRSGEGVERAAVIKYLSKNGAALQSERYENYRGDRDAVLAAVSNHGFALQFASEELQGDRAIVLAAMVSAGEGVLRFATKELRGYEKDERTEKFLFKKDAQLAAEARKRRLRTGCLTWRERNRDLHERSANQGNDDTSSTQFHYVPSTETIVPNALTAGSGAFTMTKYRWVTAIWQRFVRLALSGLPLQRLLVFMHGEKKSIKEMQLRGDAPERIQLMERRLRRLQSSSILKVREDEVSRLRRHVVVRKPTLGDEKKGPPRVECACCGIVIAVPDLADHQRGKCHGVKVYDSASTRMRGLGPDFPEGMDAFRDIAKAPFAPSEAAVEIEEEEEEEGKEDAVEPVSVKDQENVAENLEEADAGLDKSTEAQQALALARASCAWERTLAGEEEVINGCWNEPVGRPPPPLSVTSETTTVVSRRILLDASSSSSAVVSMVAMETKRPSACSPLSNSVSASETIRPIKVDDTTIKNIHTSAGMQMLCYRDVFELFNEQMKPTSVTRVTYLEAPIVEASGVTLEPAKHLLVHSESVAVDRDYKLSEATPETTLGDDKAGNQDVDDDGNEDEKDEEDSSRDGINLGRITESDAADKLGSNVNVVATSEEVEQEAAERTMLADMKQQVLREEWKEFKAREAEQKQLRLQDALRSVVIAHDQRGLNGLRSLWWRSWAVGKHDQHSLATHLRLRQPSLDRARKRLLCGPSLRYDPSTATALCRVAAVGFSLESDVAVTCCGAGIVDVWKLTSEGAPRLLASWSSTPSWNDPNHFVQVQSGTWADASSDMAQKGSDFLPHPPEPDSAELQNGQPMDATAPCNGWDSRAKRCRYGAACLHRAVQLVAREEVKSDGEGQVGEGRAGMPIEGIVVDRKGQRALLCLGPRRPRPKSQHVGTGKRMHASKLAQYPAWAEDTERPAARSRLLFLDLGTGQKLRSIARAHRTPVVAMAVSSSSSSSLASSSGQNSECSSDDGDVAATIASGNYSHVKIWPFPPRKTPG